MRRHEVIVTGDALVAAIDVRHPCHAAVLREVHDLLDRHERGDALLATSSDAVSLAIEALADVLGPVEAARRVGDLVGAMEV
jgi:hypothetical protein